MLDGCGWEGFFEVYAALARMSHLIGEVRDADGGFFGIDAKGMDIRDDVSAGVVVAWAGLECEIGGEALAGCESRPFADEQDDDAGM